MKDRCVSGLLALSCLLLPVGANGQSTVDYTVQVSAAAQSQPPQITLSWPVHAASGYSVYRKGYDDTSWGSAIATLPGGATGYTDSVAAGVAYEYQVQRQSSPVGIGYVAAGVAVPLVESRGKVLLLIDATHAGEIASEITRLQRDLVGDGWTVLRHDIAPGATVPAVKALISSDYASDPSNTKAVYLLGHVPVPYSGAIAPDGHGDHYGAWPADGFYGDVVGTWTDLSNYDSTVAGRQHNVAGDGKYDQSYFPADLRLQVGRVDLSNMSAFQPLTETDLLRRYLDKDHRFRQKQAVAQPRGLIDDNFGAFGGEAFAASGWRNFSAFFGAANVFELDWFSTLPTESYLWAYGCGGGWYEGASGVGSTGNFAASDSQAVFTMLFGSYHGDWDVPNNFLRAPLAGAGLGLTDAWAGRPAWFFHHMGMGETIGYSTRLSQNNTFLYSTGFAARSIHIALMGDPTLRLHAVAPPSFLNVRRVAGQAQLVWSASPDSVAGYNVHRAVSVQGPFTRVNTGLVAGTAFTDPSGGNMFYMVRAVALETGGGGSYFNASEGAFQQVVGDVSGDGRADLLWRNSSTGQNAAWAMNGTAFSGVVDLPGLSNPDFQIQGLGDFDGDGFPDIVWRNLSTGQNAVWLMTGTGLSRIVDLPALSNSNYQIQAVGDFNGDGKPDIVWRNRSTGQNALWILSGTDLVSIVDLPSLAGSSWQIVGTGDFNGNGQTDIVLRNSSSGQDALWLMNGTALASIVDLPALANSSYRIGAIADYDGNGKPDIVWRNQTTGQNAIWLMNGTALSSVVDLPALANLGFEMAGPR